MPAASGTISKVYVGKAGVGEYGPWQAYSFRLDGDERRYDYFQSGDKPVPLAGMKVSFMFEEKQSGKYTNNKVKQFEIDKNAPVPVTAAADSISNAGLTDCKVFEIAYEALYKGAASPERTPEENHANTIKALHLMMGAANDFAKQKNRTISALSPLIDPNGPMIENQIALLEAHMTRDGIVGRLITDFTEWLYNTTKCKELKDEKGELHIGRLTRGHATYLINHWGDKLAEFWVHQRGDNPETADEPTEESAPEPSDAGLPF